MTLLTTELKGMSGVLGSFGGGMIMVLSPTVNSPVRTLRYRICTYIRSNPV